MIDKKFDCNLLRNVWQPISFLSARYGGGVRGFAKAVREAVAVFFQQGPRQFYVQLVRNVNASGYRAQYHFSRRESSRMPAKVATSPVNEHTQDVDIVICVHNAFDDVKKCLTSVLQYTSPPFQLILVDDGSDIPTRDFLVDFPVAHQNVTLIRNEQAQGYTIAANQGLKKSKGEYVVLLNSDTIVSSGWLDRMIRCAESAESIAIVGPLSNTASWQSVPEIEQDGDWASNPLPEGLSIDCMAALVAKESPCLYPRLSFLNGFCLLIKRKLINDIGYFDEEIFGRGFCEENDYCLRARLNNWELAVGDDVYVFHAQSKSYSNERRKKLAAESFKAFAAKFGQSIIDDGVNQCRYDRVMLGIRARAKHLAELDQVVISGKSKWQGKRVDFILPASEPGGGGNVVIAEAEAMLDMGVEARIINLTPYRYPFLEGYPTLRVPIVWAASGEQTPDLVAGSDAVIATACHTVQWLLPLVNRVAPPKIGYYIQDYEPNFYKKGSIKYEEAKKSYSLIPNIIRFTKTRWNREELYAQLGLDSSIIGVSFNNALFRPYPRQETGWPNRPLRVVAMVRPSSVRRGAKLTMRVFARLNKIYQEKIEFIIFGAESDDPSLKLITPKFPHKNLGVISSETLVSVFADSDIFVDFSQYQAMGLTAMEAMACGLAVAVTNNGGAHDFAIDNNNCLLVDTSSEDSCFRAVKILVENHRLRNTLQTQAICDMAQYSSVKCAYNILNILLNELINDYEPDKKNP